MTKGTITLTNKSLFLCALVFASAFWDSGGHLAAAEPPKESEILLDGIASVISFNQTDESAALLVLNSDVELLARVLLVFNHGADWQSQPVDSIIKLKARRLGVIVRVLSHVAMQIGETVDSTKRRKWLSRFTVQGGGPQAIQKLLSQCGTSQADLEFWFSNFQLCRVQLQYMADKIQMPSQGELKKLFQKGDHPLAGSSWEQAQEVYEHLVRNRKLQRILTEWLAQFEKQGSIRFPK
ncbi:MAG: hypothetical protein JXR76_01550 [Deltaproteobacteria bacterium]|nr:hypothetical protein [Deltaproteobacteria bacterium]